MLNSTVRSTNKGEGKGVDWELRVNRCRLLPLGKKRKKVGIKATYAEENKKKKKKKKETPCGIGQGSVFI